MTGTERERRDSRALEPELITDPQERAIAEARNGLRQYDAAAGAIQAALERGSFKLRPSLVLTLQREALAGISSYAGNYRPGGVSIEGSQHEPVGAHLVPELVEDMCDYVNDHWSESTPIHLAAYVMWRFELDSSICRWQRPDVANGLLRCPVHSSGRAFAGHPNDTRSDCRQSRAVFRGVRCSRFCL
jgi:hypothetical protein